MYKLWSPLLTRRLLRTLNLDVEVWIGPAYPGEVFLHKVSAQRQYTCAHTTLSGNSPSTKVVVPECIAEFEAFDTSETEPGFRVEVGDEVGELCALLEDSSGWCCCC